MNTNLLNAYVTLLLAGLMLIGLEIYIPGGILGVLGALGLLAAIVVGFAAFPAPYGFVSALAIVALSTFALFAWALWVPHTRVGRRMTLKLDGRDFRLDTPADDGPLEGREGVAQSTLRPSGVALIDGRRRDVVAEDGTWIDAGTRVRIVSARGARIVVQTADSAPAADLGKDG